MRRLLILAAASGVLALAQVPQKPPESPNPPFFKGDKEKDTDPNGRRVQGTVEDPQEARIAGAVVKIKNKKTLTIRSFITKDDGKYNFGNLRMDTDYELTAEHKGGASDSKTISVFDDRKLVVLNLVVEPKKK